jgi:hypothetical protein
VHAECRQEDRAGRSSRVKLYYTRGYTTRQKNATEEATWQRSAATHSIVWHGAAQSRAEQSRAEQSRVARPRTRGAVEVAGAIEWHRVRPGARVRVAARLRRGPAVTKTKTQTQTITTRFVFSSSSHLRTSGIISHKMSLSCHRIGSSRACLDKRSVSKTRTNE